MVVYVCLSISLFAFSRLKHFRKGSNTCGMVRTDEQTDGRTDGGEFNSPPTSLCEAGDKKKSLWSLSEGQSVDLPVQDHRQPRIFIIVLESAPLVGNM